MAGEVPSAEPRFSDIPLYERLDPVDEPGMSQPPTASSERPRVFGIGLNRTGTTSLDAALWRLGWRSAHNPPAERMARGDFGLFSTDDDAYNAGTDVSVAACYRELDEAFPGSKFVLTVRDAEDWLRSVVSHFAKLPKWSGEGDWKTIRERVYSSPWPTPEQFLEGYRAHLIGVAQHFRERPDDLLVMNISAGEGWEKLCPFLGVSIPDIDFPNTNRSDHADGVGHPEEASKPLGASELRAVFARAQQG